MLKTRAKKKQPVFPDQRAVFGQSSYRGQAEFDNIHHAVPRSARFIIPLNNPSPAACSPTGLRVIKTHLPCERIPIVPEALYIACVRDPKDVFVSAYHFSKAIVFGPLAMAVEQWVKFMFSDRFQHSWAEHLARYWAVRHEPNVLFLTYEDMHKNHPGTVQESEEVLLSALNVSYCCASDGWLFAAL